LHTDFDALSTFFSQVIALSEAEHSSVIRR